MLVWFGLLGPIVDTLENGTLLLADELDASLLPGLTQQIVRLFQNPTTNPNRLGSSQTWPRILSNSDRSCCL